VPDFDEFTFLQEHTEPEASEASVLDKDSQRAADIQVRRCPGLASQASTLSTTVLSEVVLASAFDDDIDIQAR
jgi:hypothetical protein